mmetsp:Transcript_22220/g.61907  ORF Transcript_22220/g.61907 Transcript_22220/m.61907 type:complete len:125 (-) Transcript_22220:1518-1892(-)
MRCITTCAGMYIEAQLAAKPSALQVESFPYAMGLSVRSPGTRKRCTVLDRLKMMSPIEGTTRLLRYTTGSGANSCLANAYQHVPATPRESMAVNVWTAISHAPTITLSYIVVHHMARMCKSHDL